jgi:hypothetical protein
LNRVIRTGYLKWDNVFRIEVNDGQQVVVPLEDASFPVGENIAEAKDSGHPALSTAFYLERKPMLIAPNDPAHEIL